MMIILVRHGESERNIKVDKSDDSKLTRKGILQAQNLGKRLKKDKIKINEIYTSNLIRTKETADIIARILNVPVRKGLDELNEYDPDFLRSRIKIIFDVRLRKLKKFIKKITRKKERDKTILIIAHGVMNAIIVGILLQFPIRKQLLRLRYKNASLTFLNWDKPHKNWRLDLMNDTHHLQGKSK